MKKTEQNAINTAVLAAIEEFNAARNETPQVSACRLRSCAATVLVFPNYYALQSYNTIIAIIDRRTDTLYDFLRYVYGFTRTSAQHISKFEQDYCAGKWNCADRYIYREV